MPTTGSARTLDDSVHDRLLRERIVVLGQEVDDAVANRVVAQLLLLAAEDPTRDITLYVNSPGGSVTAGHSGQSVEQITADFDRDRWFFPVEAAAYGLIDRVVSRP